MSRYSGSSPGSATLGSSVLGLLPGELTGLSTGDVWRSGGIYPSVSNTKTASPPSPNFMGRSVISPLTIKSTFFCEGLNSWNLPNRTWKGEHASSPSGCSTTITSMAPDNVAGLMELHVLETDPIARPTFLETNLWSDFQAFMKDSLNLKAFKLRSPSMDFKASKTRTITGVESLFSSTLWFCKLMIDSIKDWLTNLPPLVVKNQPKILTPELVMLSLASTSLWYLELDVFRLKISSFV
ncbi:hypothetical protein OGAPHI_007107 [Ogataea philodendri]|uniref:Uncharacterized protein n=1 Tax=Ogataea philodendri TaxID=1378263 RepID=A0A9P8NWI3_9ASCO|nr:uncharacterized protein OGAPHI_007107 [Ogataea philodendri]KAH3660521.1 hypothetical protein OGAPHI_007107 [Ogataea philodendri]